MKKIMLSIVSLIVLSSSFLQAKDTIVLPYGKGITVKNGTESFHSSPDGDYRCYLLAKNYLSSKGSIMKAGEKICVYENNKNPKSFVLAKDWSSDGKTFKGGTKFEVYNNSISKSFTLSKPFYASDGLVIAGDYEVTVHPNGNLWKCKIANDWREFKAGDIIEISDNGDKITLISRAGFVKNFQSEK